MDFKKEGFSFVDKRNMIQHKQLIRNREAGLSLPARLPSHKTSAEAPDCTCGWDPCGAHGGLGTGPLLSPRTPPPGRLSGTARPRGHDTAPGHPATRKANVWDLVTIRMRLVDKPADVQLWLGIQEIFQNTR